MNRFYPYSSDSAKGVADYLNKQQDRMISLQASEPKNETSSEDDVQSKYFLAKMLLFIFFSFTNDSESTIILDIAEPHEKRCYRIWNTSFSAKI